MAMEKKTIAITLIEDWALGLLDTIPATEWKSAGYAKAELLFILLAAAILNEETPTDWTLTTETVPGGPTYVTGSNFTGQLLSKPSVQNAMKAFFEEGAKWGDLYDAWEAELTKKEAFLPIMIWRGVASCCAKKARY